MQAGTVKDHVLAGVRAAIIDLDGTMLDTVPDFMSPSTACAPNSIWRPSAPTPSS